MHGKTKPRKPTTRKPKAKPRTPKEEAAQQEAASIVGGAVVTIHDNGTGGQAFQFQLVEGTKAREVPILLRQAATIYERQLVEG